MNEKITLEYAVYGSLTNGSGEGGNIVSSSGISADNKIENCIIKLDDELQDNALKYRIQSDQNSSNLFYLLNIPLNNRKTSKIVIKVIPEFTFFPNLKRYISRREYYVITKGDVNNFNQLIRFIPESIQYKRERHDILPLEIDQEKKSTIADNKVLYVFLKALLERKALAINNRQNQNELNEQVLAVLDFLPEIYKDYIQFGLGLKVNDKFASNYLHLYTSIDGGENLDDLKKQSQFDFILNAFLSAFTSSNFQFNDDLEIDNTTNSSSKDNLYELFTCHYTYTFCHIFLKGEIENVDSYKFVFEQIKSLIKKFIERPELFERIILLYKALAKEKQSDKQTFNLFWNKYFSLNEFKDKKLDTILYNDLSFHISNLGLEAKNFYEIVSISNNIFSNSIAKIVPSIRNKIKFDYLIKSEELNPGDFASIFSFYNQHKQEISDKLSINNLILKFKIANNYKQLKEVTIKSILAPDLINEIQPEIIAPLLQHIGLKEFLALYEKSDYLSIKKSEAKQFVHTELLKPELVTLLVNEKTNWIFFTLSVDEKKNISDRFYDYIINQIESKSDKRQDFQTLLKAEKFILTAEQVNSFISNFFSKKLKPLTTSEFIEEILSVANKKHLELNISSDFLTDSDMQLVQIVPVIYTNSNLFNKENFKQFSKELLENIWNINNYEIVVKASLSDTILKTDMDSKENFYTLLMQNIKGYFQNLDFQSLHKHFLSLIEIKSNDKDFWNAFSKSELPDHLKNKYSSEPFNRKTILELNEVYKKNFQSTFTDSYLPFFIYGIDGMLYQKHFKHKSFNAMKTVSLINRILRIIIYTVFLICIALFIWVSVLYVKVNSTNKQLRLQNQGLDSLKKEIITVKTKNDSLVNYIKNDSTFNAKPSSRGNK